MPQGHWEKAFWACARSGDFKPYPPSHYRKKKTGTKKRRRKLRKGEQGTFSFLGIDA